MASKIPLTKRQVALVDKQTQQSLCGDPEIFIGGLVDGVWVETLIREAEPHISPWDFYLFYFFIFLMEVNVLSLSRPLCILHPSNMKLENSSFYFIRAAN